jgi:hypothetical protein
MLDISIKNRQYINNKMRHLFIILIFTTNSESSINTFSSDVIAKNIRTNYNLSCSLIRY